MSLAVNRQSLAALLGLLLLAALTSSWLVFPYLLSGREILSQTGHELKLEQLQHSQTVSQQLSRRFITRNREEIIGTFATDSYFTATQQLPAMQALEADRYHVFFIAESLHVGRLPGRLPEVTLLLPDDTNIAPASIDGPLVADHHRSITVKFDKRAASGEPVIPETGAPFRLVIQNFYPDGRDYVAWLEWNYPMRVSVPESSGFAMPWLALLLAVGLLSSVLTPCMLQLSVMYFAVLAGSPMMFGAGPGSATEGARSSRQLITFSLAFILGFVLLFAAVGGLIGWAGLLMQAYLGLYSKQISVAAGTVVCLFAVYLAYQARVPLVCRLPIAGLAQQLQRRSMLASAVLAVGYSLGCLTCFGGAIIGTLLVYIGTLNSPVLGAGIMGFFALGVGLPFLAAAWLLARSPTLMRTLWRWQRPVQFITVAVVLFFGLVLVTDNYHVLSDALYPYLGLQ